MNNVGKQSFMMKIGVSHKQSCHLYQQVFAINESITFANSLSYSSYIKYLLAKYFAAFLNNKLRVGGLTFCKEMVSTYSSE